MKHTSNVFLINPDVRAIKVTYDKDTEKQAAQRYTYKTFDKSIKIGDYVVVPTGTRHNMTVCKVVEVDVQDSIDFEHGPIEIKWIISRVDTQLSDESIGWEDKAESTIREAQTHKKREELRKALEESLNGKLEELKALPLPTVTPLANIE